MSDKPHILLVDDEPRFAESLQRILKNHKYSSTIASNGSEAITLLDTYIFDLVLLDIDLPDMTGVEIIDFVKESHTTTPIIMMTGNASVETAVQAMKKGAYDYLRKPFLHDLLIATIEKAIKHSRLEKKLRESEKRFKTLSEASWEGVVIHDNGILVEANRQFFDIFGYRKEELLGSNILRIIFNSESSEKISHRIKHSILGSHEAIGVKEDGSEFPIETRSSHIEFQGEQLRVCALRDITERKKAEQDKLRLQMQLAKASKMEALGLMAGSVAHDLNNILAGIVSFPEVMLMEMDMTKQQRESVRIIQDAGKRAASVVSDLLTIARGSTTQKAAKNPNNIITNYLDSIEHREYLTNYPNITIKTLLDDNLHNMYCSTNHIGKALMNLICNAMEALETKGVITISTKNISLDQPLFAHERIERGDYIKITISDNGPGIPPKDIEHIFEPFYSKKVMGRSGTGLGLAIVWSTIHDHNGFINIESSKKGTFFELFIPSTEQAEMVDNPVLSINALRGNGEAILVVDDQETQCAITRNLLKNIGYHAFSVNSGEDALKLYKNKPIDLLILDMILEEGMNGRETYEQILKINPLQKAIVISGFSENEELDRIGKLGVSHFIRKPYTLDQLGIAVKQTLSSSPGRM